MTLPEAYAAEAPESFTILDVERVIERHRDALVRHPFLVRLQGEGSIDQFQRMAPRLAFFVLVFQDVLRIARDLCTDAQIRTIASRHALEDSGHDRWYLDDLKRLGIPLELRWVFSAEHELAREVGYRLVSEVLRAPDDTTRLAVVLSLEAIGREFFIRVPGFAQRLGISDGLTYFAVRHLDIERGHGVFASDAQNQLARIAIPAHAVAQLLSAVNNTFTVMTLLADDLDAAMSGVVAAVPAHADESIV